MSDEDVKAPSLMDKIVAANAPAEEERVATPKPKSEPKSEPKAETVSAENDLSADTALGDIHETDAEDVEELEDIETPAELKARLARESFEKRKEKAARRKAEEELEVLRGMRQDQGEVYAHDVQARAEELAGVKMYIDASTKIADKARSEYKDFDRVLNSYKETFPDWNGVPRPLVEAIIDTSDGDEHKVLYYLGKNLDLAEDLMEMSERKRVIELVKIATKLKEAKPVSKVPKPIRPVGGGSKAEPKPLLEVEDPKEYIARRNAELIKRREMRYGR